MFPNSIVWPIGLGRASVRAQRFADHSHMRRIQPIALIEQASFDKGNSECLEIFDGRGRRNLQYRYVACRETEKSKRRLSDSKFAGVLGCSSGLITRNMPFGRPPSSGRPVAAPTLRAPGISLSRSIKLWKKDHLVGFGFLIVPPHRGKRNIHRDNPVYAEARIDFEHLH